MKKNSKIIITTIIVAVGLLLLGCNNDSTLKDKKDKSEGYKLYYINSTKDKIVSDDFNVKSTDIDRVINEIIMKLKVGNYVKSKEPVIPKEIESSAYTLSANILNLNFDSNYLELKGRDEVLRRAAIVLTFCQLDEIDFVRITVAGKALQIDGKDVGNMSKESFVDIIGNESDYMINENVSLYYADSSGKKLRKLNVNIKSDGTKMLEELVVEKIIEGPSGTDKLGFYNTIDPDTKINRIAVNDNICYVDLSKELLDRQLDITNEVIVYSIVNSLTELKTVNQVRITINGQTIDTYDEYSKLVGILERNYDIINTSKTSGN